jgi:segregation and condensation protein B
MNLSSQIETLLLVSAKPMPVKQLAGLLGRSAGEVEKEADKLAEDYKREKRGIQVIKNESKYQIVSAPENSKLVQEFIKDEATGELTKPSLETLTIIAYRGPISKINLDRIRGVNCSLILRNLLIRGLIEDKFNRKKKEIYYNITLDFIRFLGLNKIEELPDYERLHQDETIDRMLAGAEKSEEAVA